jgi:tetratricopeptide (TPR) repeat protein/transcriptional regulator with XRE-family HTH domain
VSFDETLRELRVKAALTQSELAARAGVSERTVSKTEHGIPCSPGTARRLAAALGLTGTAQVRFVAGVTGGDHGNGIPLAVAAATRTLPHDVATFTGREEELRQLREFANVTDLAEGASRICVVHGMAGVGKSALAVHFAHEVADRFPDGQLYVSLYGHEDQGRPVEPADVLSALLLAVDILPRAIPDGLEGRAALWRSELAKRRMLLLLDDASGSEQIRPLLPGSGGTLVLVTSRQRVTALPEAADIPLETMTRQDAADLFVRVARRPSQQADSPAVATVVALCGFLPLTITLAAGHLRQHRVWAVADLVAALTENDGGLGRITADRLSAAFDLSYRNLAPGPQRFFRCLGLHPGSDIDSHAAAALAGVELGTARTLLDELFDYHLIEEPATRGRYRFHDLIREHARAAAAVDPADERLAVLRRLLAYYLHMARAADSQLARRTPSGVREILAKPPARAQQLLTPHDAFAWMDVEYLNLHAATAHAAASGMLEYAIAIPAAMDSYLFRRGYWRQALDLSGIALGAARDLRDDLSAARTLTDIGRLKYMLADMEAACAILTEALDLHRTLADPLGEAHARAQLANANLAVGDFEAAAGNLLAALTLYRQVDDPRGQAHAASRLGVVQFAVGDRTAAIENQQAALSAYAALTDPIGRAHALAHLAEMHASQGRYGEGIEAAAEALELFRAAQDHVNVAGCLFYLGAIQRDCGYTEQASANLGRALEMFREAGDEWDEANVRDAIGRLQTQTGQYAAAEASLARAGEVYFRDGGMNGHVSTVLNSRGELALAVADPAAALVHHTTALEIAVKHSMKDEEARACEGIGRSRLQAGRRDLAVAPLRSALGIYELLGSPYAERVRALLR